MKKILLYIFLVVLIGLLMLLVLGQYELLLGMLIALMPMINMLVWIGIGLLFYVFGKKLGGDKARRELKKELKQLEISNPFIYFRDIPNKYGIGVSVAILNVKFSKKDVLAGILDLSAKGYINFKQVGKSYEIIDNHKDKTNLLKNELFLLKWVTRTNKHFNLSEWVKLSKEDAIELGLATNNNQNEYRPLFKMDSKYAKDLLFVSYGFAIFLIRIMDFFMERSIGIIETLFMALFLTGPVWFVVFLIMLFVAIFYDGKILNYNKHKENTLVLTDFGKNEYHELCGLGKFLDDFGSFADKHIDEIVIWEQYLSYALMFRLSKKILSTGYDKLKINDSFIIDNLDRIVL